MKSNPVRQCTAASYTPFHKLGRLCHVVNKTLLPADVQKGCLESSDDYKLPLKCRLWSYSRFILLCTHHQLKLVFPAVFSPAASPAARPVLKSFSSDPCVSPVSSPKSPQTWITSLILNHTWNRDTPVLLITATCGPGLLTPGTEIGTYYRHWKHRDVIWKESIDFTHAYTPTIRDGSSKTKRC